MLVILNRCFGKFRVSNIVSVVASLAIVVAPARSNGQQVADLKETPLAEAQDFRNQSFAVSGDGLHFAQVSKDPNGKWYVIWDGVKSQAFDAIKPCPVLSFDGKHLAYGAKVDNEWRIVVDNKLGDRFEQINDWTEKGDLLDQLLGAERGWFYHGPFGNSLPSPWVTFGHDGDEVAYVSKRGAKWVVVRDGKSGPEHDKVFIKPIITNTKRLVYIARDGKTMSAVVDFTPGKAYDGITEGIANGDDLYYLAKSGSKYRIVANGTEGPEYDQVFGYFVAPDKTVSYVARTGNHLLTVIGGKVISDQEAKFIDGPVASDDASTIAFIAAVGGRQCAVVNGKVFQSYGSYVNNTLSLTPDGKHIGYAYRRNPGYNVVAVVDEVVSTRYDNIRDIPFVFSPDGTRCAIAAVIKATRGTIVVDGKIGPDYSAPQKKTYSLMAVLTHGSGSKRDYPAWSKPETRVVFTDDGKHYAYAIEKRLNEQEWWIVEDGSPVVQKLNDIVWGPYYINNKLAAVSMAGTCGYIVYDGKTGPVYDEILAQPTFDPDGTVRYLALKKDKIVLVSHRF